MELSLRMSVSLEILVAAFWTSVLAVVALVLRSTVSIVVFGVVFFLVDGLQSCTLFARVLLVGLS